MVPAVAETQTLNYPHDFRTPHRFVMQMPADWVIIEAPGTLFAAATPGDHAGPWVNATVEHRRIEVRTLEATFQADSDELRESLSGAEILSEPSFRSHAGDRRFVRMTRYTEPTTGEIVARIDISMVAPNPLGFLVDDMFTLTFTTPDSDDQALAQELMETAGTFEFV